MNCTEKLLEPRSSSIYTPSHHRILVPKVFDAFKSNLEFRYQIIVSSIKFTKRFCEVYDTDSLV